MHFIVAIKNGKEIENKTKTICCKKSTIAAKKMIKKNNYRVFEEEEIATYESSLILPGS